MTAFSGRASRANRRRRGQSKFRSAKNFKAQREAALEKALREMERSKSSM